MKFTIDRLHSGGLNTNYDCTSKCKHCLYVCSPRWEKKYIDSKTTKKNLLKIMNLGCASIHIGGGEPFINPDGLKMVIKTALSLGMDIKYVETNSSWYRNPDSACQILSSLKEIGLTALLISISPFHNEYIPFYKVKGVIEACNVLGMDIFPWIQEFYEEIDAFDDRKPHAIAEYEERYGIGYLKNIPSRYWVHFGGRALKTFSGISGIKPFQEILLSNEQGCDELIDVSHFHIDLFGNYIPGLCSGLAIQCDDLGDVISEEKYPILHLLFNKGITALFDFAVGRFNFKPSAGYMSKCHLCFEIRRNLVLERGVAARELQPKGIYEHY